MAKAFFTLLVALLLAGLTQFRFISQVSAAAEPTAFTNVYLQVYPEYDDPRLLVMLQGDVPQGTAIPTTVRFLVPTGAEMYSAGSLDAQGKYKGGPPDRKGSEIAGWDEISYTLTTKTFRMEYYFDSITGLPDKTVGYEFRTLYPIDSMQVELLQPARASNFSATPEWQSKGTYENMSVYRYRYGNITPDKPLTFSISYTKPDSNPSVKPSTGSSSAASSPNLVWILGIVGAGVVAVGAIWYTSSRRRYRPKTYRSKAAGNQRPTARTYAAPAKASSPPTPSRPSRSGRPAPRGQEGALFCRKCGTRMNGQAQFCPRCGTRIG